MEEGLKRKIGSGDLLDVFSSVAQSCLTLRPHGLQHARLPGPSPTPGASSNSMSIKLVMHPTIPFSACLQSFPASRSVPVSQFFTSGGQSIGASTSASVLPVEWEVNKSKTGKQKLDSKFSTLVDEDVFSQDRECKRSSNF